MVPLTTPRSIGKTKDLSIRVFLFFCVSAARENPLFPRVASAKFTIGDTVEVHPPLKVVALPFVLPFDFSIRFGTGQS